VTQYLYEYNLVIIFKFSKVITGHRREYIAEVFSACRVNTAGRKEADISETKI
jgi:hypothetical protein